MVQTKTNSCEIQSASAQSRDTHQKGFSIWKIWHTTFPSEHECIQEFIYTDNKLCSTVSVCLFAYQGIKHQSIKSVTVRVLHHDVEESIQSVLQKLEWQTHGMLCRTMALKNKTAFTVLSNQTESNASPGFRKDVGTSIL